MTPKPKRARASTSQLDLPFVQPDTLRDLAYYLGICNVFAAYHKRWPTPESPREEFRAARIADYDGQRLERELRFPGPALEADPAYQALRQRCLADDPDAEPGIFALHPGYREVLKDEDVAALFDTIALPGNAGPGAVRYATGLPAHAHDELTLRPGAAVRAQGLALAGLDPDDPMVRAKAFSVRVRATGELTGFMERIGMPLPSAPEGLADHYLLEADDQGRLTIRYQLREGSRYAGRFDVRRLSEKLASAYTASPDLARLRDTWPNRP
jgi:hypothetical protein